jgi:hypothetical protein
MKTENFIPFSKRDLIGHLSGKIDDDKEREGFRAFCTLVEAYYHFRFHRDLEELKEAYTCLDPDRTTKTIAGVSPKADPSSGPALLDKMRRLLVSANYREITRERIEEAFGSASPWGLQLKVDIDEYALLALYYREEYPESSVKKTLFLSKKFDYSVFRQVVLVFQLSKKTDGGGRKARRKGQGKYQEDRVYLKLFKNVPTVDLEMLFPDTEIQIRLFDKVKVILPLAVGVVSSLYKILGYILGHGNAQRLWTQVGFWALVGGLFGVALKGFFGYRNTVEKYLRSLTESLYFQNLDNDSGVFKYLLDEAEEEECKELILGYFFLHRAPEGALAEEALDRQIEGYLKDELKAEIDFEVDESLRKLKALGLLDRETTALGVLPLPAAIEKLQKELAAQAGL